MDWGWGVRILRFWWIGDRDGGYECSGSGGLGIGMGGVRILRFWWIEDGGWYEYSGSGGLGMGGGTNTPVLVDWGLGGTNTPVLVD